MVCWLSKNITVKETEKGMTATIEAVKEYMKLEAKARERARKEWEEGDKKQTFEVFWWNYEWKGKKPSLLDWA